MQEQPDEQPPEWTVPEDLQDLAEVLRKIADEHQPRSNRDYPQHDPGE